MEIFPVCHCKQEINRKIILLIIQVAIVRESVAASRDQFVLVSASI